MDVWPGNLYFSDMAEPLPKDRHTKAMPVPAFSLYGEALRPPDEATVHVETIAARSRLHDWTIQPHRHRDLHQILIVQSGGVEASLDDRSTTISGPGVVVVPPDVVHGFRFEVATVGLVASFASGLAQDLAGRAADLHRFLQEHSAVPLTRATFAAIDLSRLSTMLLREFKRSALGRECALRGLLGALVANVYRVAHRPDTGHAPADARAREVVAKFREVTERSFRRHSTVAAYCRAIGVSESQLRRACMAVTGQAPIALVHLRMLVEAERQLRYTAMPITQVAYFLGFDDPAYFTRFFTRGTGLSPKAFRARG